MALEADGKLDFQDPVSKYIGELSGQKQDITIDQLLRHHSGLTSGVGDDYEPIAEPEFLERIDRSQMAFVPGVRFHYSNVGYSLLGIVIERVTGVSYEQYLADRLLQPVGIYSTGYSIPDYRPDSLAVGYEGNDEWGRPNERSWNGPEPYWNLKANGGILSTTEDLFRWIRALAHGQVLNTDALSTYLAPQSRTEDARGSYYAYGWDVHVTACGTRVTWHNGTNGVFYAVVHWFPDEDTVIVSLSNAADEQFYGVNDRISI